MTEAAGLTSDDGKFGPTDGLPLLQAFQCGHLDSAEVRGFILPLQVADLEAAVPPALCPVQGEAVLVILMSERLACTVDKFPMEMVPSPGYTHSGILG